MSLITIHKLSKNAIEIYLLFFSEGMATNSISEPVMNGSKKSNTATYDRQCESEAAKCCVQSSSFSEPLYATNANDDDDDFENGAVRGGGWACFGSG